MTIALTRSSDFARGVVPLAAAGLVAPIWFTAIVIVQGLLQPDYSHRALPISALAAWPYGWIQNLNFYVYGCLLTAFAIGLHRGVRSTPGGVAGPAMLVVAASGAVLAGLVPWTRVNGVLVETPGHVVGAVAHFLGSSIAFILISRRLARDPRWRGLTPYVLVSGIALLAMFIGFAMFVIPDDAAWRPWAGVAQRVIVAVLFTCIMVLAARLLGLARQAG